MPEGLRAELILDARRALATADDVERRLQAAVSDLRVSLDATTLSSAQRQLAGIEVGVVVDRDDVARVRNTLDQLVLDVDVDEAGVRRLSSEISEAARSADTLEDQLAGANRELREGATRAGRLDEQLDQAAAAAGLTAASVAGISAAGASGAAGLAGVTAQTGGLVANLALLKGASQQGLGAVVQQGSLSAIELEKTALAATVAGLSLGSIRLDPGAVSRVGELTDDVARLRATAITAPNLERQLGINAAAAAAPAAASGLKGIGVGLAAVGAGFAISAVRNQLQLAVGAASDLAESTSKSQVVFGRNLQLVRQGLGDTTRTVLLSEQAALEATATFGNLFSALGLGQAEAANLSPAVVQLAADLASFNNLRVEDTLVAIRAGLVGEVEPLRRLGVAINAANVEQRAYELGLGRVGEELSEGAKVQARWNLILEQTGAAQGDVARTAEGYANTQRRVNAEIEDFRARFGEAILPAFQELLAVAPQVVDQLEQLVPSLVAIIDVGAKLVPVFVEGFKAIVEPLEEVDRFFGSVGAAVRSAFGDQAQGRILAFNNALDRLDDALEAGEDPAESLGASLGSLADKGLLTADALVRLGSRAGFSKDELLDFGREVAASGQAMGLTEGQVRAIADAVSVLTGQLGPDIEAVRQQRIEFELLGKVRTPQVFVDLPALLEAVRVKQAEFVERFREGIDVLAEAPEVLDVSAKQIVANLTEQVNAAAEFQANLVRLVAAGQDDLARELREKGPGVAGALVEFLEDPTLAAEAERLAEGRGTAISRGIATGLSKELVNLPESAKAGLDALSQFLSDPAVFSAVETAVRGGAISVGVGFRDQLDAEFGLLTQGSPVLRAQVVALIRGADLPQAVKDSVLAAFAATDVLDIVEEAGETLASRYIKGLKGPGGLAVSSPSKVMIALAKQVAKDFAGEFEKSFALDVPDSATAGIASDLTSGSARFRLRQAGGTLANAVLEGIRSALDQAALQPEVEELASSFTTAGPAFAQALGSALDSADLSNVIVDSVRDAFGGLTVTAVAEDAGTSVAQAFLKGIRGPGGLQISSPSKVMIEIARQAVSDFRAAAQLELSSGLAVSLPVSGGLRGVTPAAAVGGPVVNLTVIGSGDLTRGAARGAAIAGQLVSLMRVVRR